MVISIVIVLSGLVTMATLPVALYPDISPPTVTVTAVYPGASAQILSDTVAQPIEEQVNGVEDMLYMSSVCANDGSYKLTVTFEVGTDLDMAVVLVQNRVTIATPKLPSEVTRQGVTTLKQSTDFVLFASLYSPDSSIKKLDLDNYASINIRDVLSRVNGVGAVNILGGQDYGMRIWIDPNKLRSRDMTVEDVINAIQAQNVQVAAGVIGEEPAPPGNEFQYNVSVLGRLSDPEQFEAIILKTGSDGQITYVRDVARVELGAQSYTNYSLLNGKPATIIAVYQLPGANALQVATECEDQINRLAENFPAGMACQITYNASWFVNASIDEIRNTLFIAVILVVLTVYVFLQDWRAALIPAITIPVSLIGTFALMAMLGFSINTLSMFGLVLAIGVVVDDAIVIVENCSRKLDESKTGSAKQAAIDAMKEVTGPVIATTLVLLAVFIPTGFLGGITGRLYRQFALTIAASTCISSVNALTLSPALCALLLKPTDPNKKKAVFFRIFDFGFEKTRSAYTVMISKFVRRSLIMGVLFLAFVVLAVGGYIVMPTGFMPTEDQGYLIINAQLPDSASLERTSKVVDKADAICSSIPAVANTVSIGGYSMLDGTVASNYASFVVVLKPWDERTTRQEQIAGVLREMVQKFSQVQEAKIIAFVPPAIPGLGVTGGFQLQLEDLGSLGSNALQDYAGEIIAQANQRPATTSVYTTFRANVPQLFVDVDRTKAMTMGVPLDTVFDSMQAYLGSLYVNDFNKFGRVYQVQIQAEGQFRCQPDDIASLEVRNSQGQMLPLGTMIEIDETFGPQVISRYNMYPTAAITGQPGEGYSSGQAMNTMVELAKQILPKTMGYEWTGMSYQEIKAGNQAPYIFALAAVFVYLFLAAQYESFRIPIAVMLSIPFALLGAAGATLLRGLDNNVYTQIGVVLLIGMASKNAILIVEFAKVKHEEGQNRFDAASEAANLRFRAILMTAFSALLGWFPLVIASGAGAASRHALGTAVFGGMLTAIVIGVAFIPSLYVMVQSVADWQEERKKKKALNKNM